mmetsp:Transcript_26617/g.50230  ORF Transcript_26617/g.50230 Transcript_26617/m.50230 type:complete len:106 (-) Transcript_26617:223-540(-)
MIADTVKRIRNGIPLPKWVVIQLVALHLESTVLVHVEHSVGGVVGMAYANQYPNHVKGLVLVDAVCLPASQPWTARLADVPILGDWLVYMAEVSTLVEFCPCAVS